MDRPRKFADDEIEWKYEQLLRGGFDTVDAEKLAVSSCDYHDAIAMRKRKCPDALVVEILTD